MVDPWTLLAASICGAICLRIAAYRREGARYRPGVSVLAYLLCMGTGCFALTVFLDVLRGHGTESVSPWLLIILVVVLALVYRARGNVARIVQIDWERRRQPRHD